MTPIDEAFIALWEWGLTTAVETDRPPKQSYEDAGDVSPWVE